ncbi:MAG: GlxA family transcriptional regulator [Alphaproteobacteria bacterium]|nr:GlxA family transcriptional regulator [Alphaproteobacteria bacterium]
MFGTPSGKTPEVIGLFMVPSFSMIAFASAIEPLRLANRLSDKALYEWMLISSDGGPVTASNGISVNPHVAMSEIDGAGKPEVPTLILVSGVGAEVYDEPDTFAWLRRLDRRGADIGALCTGAHVLARAGLLEGRVCTLHWENIPSFRETYPDIEVTDDLFEIDGNRFTCSGGTAALDLMLHLIRAEHGDELATRVSEECILDHVRGGREHQRMPLAVRLGVDNRKLIDSIHLMEAHLEEPLAQGALAAAVGISRRQLERLFRRHVGRPPNRYYMQLRLDRARKLLLQTDMAVVDVAMACGFVSASHFAKCYRRLYGVTPRQARIDGP